MTKDAARGGVPLEEIHPQLADNNGSRSLKVEPFSWERLADRGVEVLFLATPHEQSREWVPEALKHGLRVVDLSGAWRLTDAKNRAVYGFEDEGSDVAATTQAQAVYGMPELHRDGDCEGKAGGESRMLCDFGDSGGPSAGCGGNRGCVARDCCRCEERRERRGQGSDGKDALYVCGGQSVGIWRVQPPAHGRVA